LFSAPATSRVICGGEDENFSDPDKRDSLTVAKTKRIQKKLHGLFPLLDSRAAVSWTGSFGGSCNGMPTIGAIPGYPRCYAVMGYGGNGITFSMLATKLISAAIFGKSVPEAELFGFNV
jgi:glycine/D-amino acid oxidase-like deaminating enzyme